MIYYSPAFLYRIQKFNNRLMPLFYVIGIGMFFVHMGSKFNYNANLVAYYAPTALKPLAVFHYYTTAQVLKFMADTYNATYSVLLDPILMIPAMVVAGVLSIAVLFAVIRIFKYVLDVALVDFPMIKAVIIIGYLISLIVYLSMFFWVKGI